MKTLKSNVSKIVLFPLLISASLLMGCETAKRYDTKESMCLVITPCPEYSQEYRNKLADEIEQTNTPLQVKTIIDYDMICKKIDIAVEGVCL